MRVDNKSHQVSSFSQSMRSIKFAISSPRGRHSYSSPPHNDDSPIPMCWNRPAQTQRDGRRPHSTPIPCGPLLEKDKTAPGANRNLSQNDYRSAAEAFTNPRVDPVRLPPCSRLLESVDKFRSIPKGLSEDFATKKYVPGTADLATENHGSHVDRALLFSPNQKASEGTYTLIPSASVDRRSITTNGTSVIRNFKEEPGEVLQMTDSSTVRATGQTEQGCTIRNRRGDKDGIKSGAVVKRIGLLTIKGKHYCGYCAYGPRQKSDMQRHVDAVHLHLRPYKCKYCELTFHQLSHAKSHEIHIHEEAPRKKCLFCDKTYTVWSSVKRHMMRDHKKQYTAEE